MAQTSSHLQNISAISYAHCSYEKMRTSRCTHTICCTEGSFGPRTRRLKPPSPIFRPIGTSYLRTHTQHQTQIPPWRKVKLWLGSIFQAFRGRNLMCVELRRSSHYGMAFLYSSYFTFRLAASHGCKHCQRSRLERLDRTKSEAVAEQCSG